MDPHYKLVSLQDPLDSRQVTFTNLQLLGFNASAAEAKWKIPFDKDMFALPNKKGFEVVMKFLLNRLNPVRFKEDFRHCWPVCDKTQEQQFRKNCNTWLTEISKEDENARLPRIVASLFMSPGGEKFYALLHAFSTYVMQKVILSEGGVKEQEYLQPMVLTQQNVALWRAMCNMLQCGTSHQRQRFLDHTQAACAVQDYWRTYSTELVRDFRRLGREVKDLERELKTEVQQLAQKDASYAGGKRRSFITDYEMEVGNLKRSEQIRRCRDLWQSVESFYRNIDRERKILESLVENTVKKYKIDATDLNVRVPDLLLRECEQEIQQRNVNNVYEGGKLNLLSVISLWNLALHLYIEKLHQAGIPSFDKALPSISTQIHTHHAHLANAKSLKKQLSHEMLPELKSSINALRRRMDSIMFDSKSPDSIRTTSVGLGLLPPTPPVSFEIDGLPSRTDEVSKSLAKTPGKDTNVSTPEGANAWMEKIQSKVHSNNKSQLVGASPVKTRSTAHLVQGNPVYAQRLLSGGNLVTRIAKYETKPESSRAGGRGKGPADDATRSALGSTSQQAARNHSKPQHASENPKSFKMHMSLGKTKKNEKSSAHDVLADKIADALLAPSPRRESIIRSKEDPFNMESLLDTAAFESKDKLGRTPVSKAKPSTWHEALMRKTEDGPLSSTQIDGSPLSLRSQAPSHQSPGYRQQAKRDSVVTKLFTDDDPYSEGADAVLSEIASNISSAETAEAGEEDELVMELVQSLREDAEDWMASKLGDEPLMEHIRPLTDHTQSMMQNIQPLTDHTQSMKQDIQPLTGYTQSKMQDIQPLTDHTQSMKQDIQPLTGYTQSKMQDIQPLTDHTQSKMQNIKLLTDHTQSMKQDIQPLTGYTQSKMQNIKLLTDHTQSMKQDIQPLTDHTQSTMQNIQPLTDQTHSRMQSIQTLTDRGQSLIGHTLSGTLSQHEAHLSAHQSPPRDSAKPSSPYHESAPLPASVSANVSPDLIYYSHEPYHAHYLHSQARDPKGEVCELLDSNADSTPGNQGRTGTEGDGSPSPVLPDRLRSILSQNNTLNLEFDKTPELSAVKRHRIATGSRVNAEQTSLLVDSSFSLLNTKDNDEELLTGITLPEMSPFDVDARKPEQTYRPTDEAHSQTGRHTDSDAEGDTQPQVRVIQLQNGNYKETVEPSPKKLLERKTLSSSVENISVPSIKPKLTSSDASDLLARYRRLQMASGQPSRSIFPASEPLMPLPTGHGDQVSLPAPPEAIRTSPLNEVFFQLTPVKVTKVKKRSLVFGGPEPDQTPVVDTGLQHHKVPVTVDVSLPYDRLPLKENVPVYTPAHSPFDTPKSKSSAIYGVSAMPFSPVTDVLHVNGGLTDMSSRQRLPGKSRVSNFAFSILDEDESVLLPASPPAPSEHRSSPPTANLLDL